MNSQILNVAMEMILYAGEARNLSIKAMQLELGGEKENAHKSLILAKENMKKAHLCQTKVIQEEARGSKVEISLLFIHAQDTLMTVATEINIMEQMINMNRHLEEKINQLHSY